MEGKGNFKQLICAYCGEGMNEKDSMIPVDKPGTDGRRWMHSECVSKKRIVCGGITFDSDFIVLKRNDIMNSITNEQLHHFSSMLLEIRSNRRAEGRDDDPEYLVVNTDETWASEVAEIIAREVGINGG